MCEEDKKFNEVLGANESTIDVECNPLTFGVLLANLTNSERVYRYLKEELNSLTGAYTLSTNWEEVNAERVEKGLQKITNQTMKDAYISKELHEIKLQYTEARLNYHQNKLMMEICMKYGLEALEGYVVSKKCKCNCENEEE